MNENLMFIFVSHLMKISWWKCHFLMNFELLCKSKLDRKLTPNGIHNTRIIMKIRFSLIKLANFLGNFIPLYSLQSYKEYLLACFHSIKNYKLWDIKTLVWNEMRGGLVLVFFMAPESGWVDRKCKLG